MPRFILTTKNWKKWRRVSTWLMTFYAKRGIKYVIFVAPNKENIYSEFMPERMQRIRKSDVSRMDKAVEYLKKAYKGGNCQRQTGNG